MHEIISWISPWVDYVREHPLVAGGVAVAAVIFYLLSNWKPKSTRDAENRLREIRDETHDYYRHLRPPGR